MSSKASFKIIRALQIEFERAHANSRVPGIDYEKPLKDSDTERKLWASRQLGHLISTFTALTPWEAGFLMDLLKAKPIRIFEELNELFFGNKIEAPDAWIAATLPRWHAENLIASPRPATLATINAREALHLREVLRRRAGR